MIVRNFSPAGPCLEQGLMTGETPKFYVFTDRYNGRTRKLRKRTPDHYSAAHIEPCRRCRDHANTDYPYGYMD